MPVCLGSGNSHDDEGWKIMAAGTRKKVSAPPEDLQVQNRFTDLTAEEELGAIK